jgi:hypothetical protein
MKYKGPVDRLLTDKVALESPVGSGKPERSEMKEDCAWSP